jgi:hypothetical protein
LIVHVAGADKRSWPGFTERRASEQGAKMAYEAMKKASQIAAVTMSSPAIPVIAPIVRVCNAPKAYVPAAGGVTENPVEKLRVEFDQAVADLRELEGLIGRAKALCNLAEMAPYRAGNWNARPTPEEAAEIRRTRKALEDFSACLPATFKTMEQKLERFNLALRGNSF